MMPDCKRSTIPRAREAVSPQSSGHGGSARSHDFRASTALAGRSAARLQAFFDWPCR